MAKIFFDYGNFSNSPLNLQNKPPEPQVDDL